MENKNLVRVKLWSDRKHYQVIEVREDEVEKVREANRMTWRELDKEIRRRKKLEEENITICSFESLDEDGTWIPDEQLNAEEKMIAEETGKERNQILADAIKQLKERQQNNAVLSVDTFYKRTIVRDCHYLMEYEKRKHINGKRLPSNMFVRTYVD